MSDKAQNGDTVTPIRAHEDAPLTPTQRANAMARFLAEYVECGNIKHSCAVAGISRKTFYEWKKTRKRFAAQLVEAEPDVNDTLEFAAYERAVKGVETYVVSVGHMVYEEIPWFDKDGEPILDEHKKQIMLRGKPLVERKYSDALLTTLLKARMPEKYKEKQSIDLSGSLDIQGAKDRLLQKLQALPDDDDDLL